MTVSPSLTCSGRRLPSLIILPGPTASTLPFCGLFLALSGSMIPPAVFSSASNRRTTIRSPNGFTFMELPPAMENSNLGNRVGLSTMPRFCKSYARKDRWLKSLAEGNLRRLTHEAVNCQLSLNRTFWLSKWQ